MKRYIAWLILFALLLCFFSFPVSGAEDNIALGKPSTSSTRYDATLTSALVNDGSYSTIWSAGNAVVSGKARDNEYGYDRFGKALLYHFR